LLRPQPSFNPILLPPGPTDGNHAMPSSITPALNTFSHHNNCSTIDNLFTAKLPSLATIEATQAKIIQ